MRHAKKAAVLALGLLMAPSSAQNLSQAPASPYPVPNIYIPPFVWNGNALDQKILDAQAQMVPAHRRIRHLGHHRRG